MVHTFGTLRRYGATQQVCTALTVRGHRDFANVIYYSRQHTKHMAQLCRTKGRYINATLAEWVMGSEGLDVDSGRYRGTNHERRCLKIGSRASRAWNLA